MSRLGTGVYGATGRMGQAICDLLLDSYVDTMALDARMDSATPLTSELLSELGVVIDFSLPDGTRRLADAWQALPTPRPVLVSGTTGLPEDTMTMLRELGDSGIVLHASNFSSGVAVLDAILRYCAPMLSDIGYRPVLTETHHVHKQDAPSGTALTLRASLEAEWPDIDTHSIRAGEVIGRHEVDFYSRSDRITLSHDATDRSLFARGALDAALWLAASDLQSGFHTMRSYFRQRFALGGPDG